MNKLAILESLLRKAEKNSFFRHLLNGLLPNVVPFNARHDYRVLQISSKEGPTKVRIPYQPNNKNHIGGIHACSLATGAELCAGLSLLARYSPKKYRLIMSHLQCKYGYQARTNCTASVEALTTKQQASLEQELSEEGKALVSIVVDVTDEQGQQVCEALVTWQLKTWDTVTLKTSDSKN